MGLDALSSGLRYRLDVCYARRVTYRSTVDFTLHRFPIRRPFYTIILLMLTCKIGCTLNRRRCGFRRKTRCAFRRWRVFSESFERKFRKTIRAFRCSRVSVDFRIASIRLRLVCIATKSFLLLCTGVSLGYNTLPPLGKKNERKGVFLYTTPLPRWKRKTEFF